LSAYFTSQVVSIYAAYSQGPEFKSQASGWLNWGYSCVSLILQGKCQVSTSNKVTCFEKLKQLQISKETKRVLMGVHWAVVNKYYSKFNKMWTIFWAATSRVCVL